MIKGKVLAKTLGFSNLYYLLSTVEDIMNNSVDTIKVTGVQKNI